MAADDFSIQIILEGDAAQTLTQNGFRLYACQAQDTNIVGWPTIWYASAALSPLMTLSWSIAGDAYTALQTDVAPPQIVTPGACYPTSPGQTLKVTGSGGTGSVSNEGVADCITIANLTTSQFTCGPARSVNGGQPAPGCALQLFGGNNILVRPRNEILVALESGTRTVGQAVETLSAPSLLVSLVGASSRSVTYSLNTNWAANIQSWATQCPAGTSLCDVLVSTVVTPLIQQPGQSRPCDEARKGPI
jgi:hypothetical protein